MVYFLLPWKHQIKVKAQDLDGFIAFISVGNRYNNFLHKIKNMEQSHEGKKNHNRVEYLCEIRGRRDKNNFKMQMSKLMDDHF